MKNFLCRIGFHDYEVTERGFGKVTRTFYNHKVKVKAEILKCKRCSHEKGLMTDEYNDTLKMNVDILRFELSKVKKVVKGR